MSKSLALTTHNLLHLHDRLWSSPSTIMPFIHFPLFPPLLSPLQKNLLKHHCAHHPLKKDFFPDGWQVSEIDSAVSLMNAINSYNIYIYIYWQISMSNHICTTLAFYSFFYCFFFFSLLFLHCYVYIQNQPVGVNK